MQLGGAGERQEFLRGLDGFNSKIGLHATNVYVIPCYIESDTARSAAGTEA